MCLNKEYFNYSYSKSGCRKAYRVGPLIILDYHEKEIFES